MSESIQLYTLYSFHPKEDYFFSIIDKNDLIFQKFQFSAYRNSPLPKNCIPIQEAFIEKYKLNLSSFLKKYDLYTCYSAGVGELFSERAVLALKDHVKEEIEFIPCQYKGQEIPIYTALFLQSASLIKAIKGMHYEFFEALNFSQKYAVQDEETGTFLVTQAFIDLIEKQQLQLHYRLEYSTKNT